VLTFVAYSTKTSSIIACLLIAVSRTDQENGTEAAAAELGELIDPHHADIGGGPAVGETPLLKLHKH
jgi:hypothetical protein